MPVLHSPAYCISALEQNLEVFRALLEPTGRDLVSWKPDPESWSLLEILCHLNDEEAEDFRTRTRYALEGAGTPLPGIDPVGWVIERGYAGRDFREVLAEFLKNRRSSISWLRNLAEPDWEASFTHPVLGPMTAGKLLCNWLAHDYLHIRQINRRKYEYLRELSGEDLSYAGNWGF